MNHEKHSLAPVVNDQSKILILGSMPGEESLRKQEYYAYPRNHFWAIMGEFFGIPVKAHYSERIKMLLSHGFALWDVVASCERVGSLDSNIKNEQYNDFKRFFHQYPEIQKIYFNGQKAYHSFLKIKELSELNVEFKTLPSTSPAHTIPFIEKLEKWSDIINQS